MAEEVGAVFELPGGLYEDGKWTTEFEVRRLKGKTRKELAKPEIRNNPSRAMDLLLQHALIRIGTHTTINRDLTDRLYTGDRDFIVLKTREITKGADANVTGNCPSCRKALTITIPMADLGMVKLVHDEVLKDEEGRPYFDLPDVEKAFGKKIEFYYPIGAHTRSIASFSTENPVEAQYALFSCCLKSWDGEVAKSVGVAFWDDQEIDLIEAIQNEFDASTPGVDASVDVECHSCGKSFPASIEILDFLFGGSKTKRG